jgi:glyoxylase-like metal-dependent hydrolase (beta-lactamase superfamily II)
MAIRMTHALSARAGIRQRLIENIRLLVGAALRAGAEPCSIRPGTEQKDPVMTRMLVLALLLAAFPAQAQPALGPFTARQLAPGIHLLATPPSYRGPVIGNVTIVEQASGVVVIDSGGAAADGRRIVAFVRSLTARPIRALVITHWHGDHPQGASAIRGAFPRVRIIATAATRDGIRGPAATFLGFRADERSDTIALNQLSGFLSGVRAASRNPAHDDATRQRYAGMIRDIEGRMADVRGTHLVLPAETFARALLLDDPERPVRLMFLGRANTAGDAIAWLPRHRIVVTGDVVVAPTPFGFFSYPRDWIGVLERLKALDFALLVPGHGEPQADAAYVDRLIATIADIRAQVAALAGQGLTLAEVRARTDFSAQTAIFGDTPRNRLQFEGFWLTPMVENAYREARGEPIVQGGGS